MKRILIVGTLLLAILVAVFRQRIFVRDPLGKVERNAVAADGARVYINYSNDVLVEDSARHEFVMVQGWSGLPGVPQHLFCLTGLSAGRMRIRRRCFQWRVPAGGRARR